MNKIEEQLNRNYWIQKTISSVLKLSLKPISLQKQLERTLALILSIPWLSIESKGCIFLVDEHRHVLKLAAQQGLSEALLHSCATVSFGSCLCGQAALKKKVVYTKCLDKRHTVRYDGIREHGHYCIPVMTGKKLLGVINTYIGHGHKRDEAEIDFLKAVANALAGVIERKRVEEALRKANDELEVTVENLKLSLEPISLKEQMKRTLALILSIPWLSLEAKGCIFLVGDDGNTLKMIAYQGISDFLVKACEKVEFGHCLCGRAAANKEIIFVDRLDERHETHYEGIIDHGHYCTPIMFGKELLGVINLYVAKGHKSNKTEKDFILSIANTLAGVIKRKQAEESLQKAKDELEIIVRKRTSKLRQLHRQNKLLLDAVAEGICGVNAKGKITFINPAAMDITGYDSDELIGRSFHNVFHKRKNVTPFHTQKKCPVHVSVVSGETCAIINEVFWTKDGTSLPVEYESTAIWEKDKIVGGVVTFRDITLRQQAEAKVRQSLQMLNNALHSTVGALSITSEIRDPYTAGHQKRVAHLACAIALRMGLRKDEIKGIKVAALLHDIGKIYVPAEFLSKPGKLTEIEHDLLRTHPQVGYDILKNIEFPWPVGEIVLQHHENMDGSGYPRGLKGDEILIEARIISVADTTEAMASHRPYRPALGIVKALEEITSHKGTLYDAKVVDACLQLVSENEDIFAVSEPDE